MVRATLESKLKDAFLEKFQQTEPIGWKVFAELMSATTSEVVVLPPVGATSDNFSVALTGKAQAIALSQDDLINLFGLNQQTCRLAENRPRCKFTIAGVKAIDFVKGKATAVVRLEKSVYPVLYHDDIKQEAAGKSLAQARQLILSDPYIKDVHIRLSMGLLGLIPKDVSKIRVEVEE